MAIRPVEAYPSQTLPGDPGYPHGKAQNVDVPGANTGTPLEAAWLNDLWGFQQALLAEAQITPSDQPDKVGASQYRDAIAAIFSTPLANRISAIEAALEATGTVERTIPLVAIPLVVEPQGGSWTFQRNKPPSDSFLNGKNGGLLFIDLAPYVPRSAMITAVDAIVYTWSTLTGGDRMRLQLCQQLFEKRALDSAYNIIHATAYATSHQVEETLTLAPTLPVTGSGAYVTLKAPASSPPAGDELRGLRVTYTQSAL